MKYVKLVAKKDTWFKESTEVYTYDSWGDNIQRLTLDEWNEWILSGLVLVRGTRVCENPRSEGQNLKVGEEYFDGESCSIDEFDVEIVDDIK